MGKYYEKVKGGEDVVCDTCGTEHTYDPVMNYDCLILIDGRNLPNMIIGAWCDEGCFNDWLDSPDAKKLFPTM
jgi:hypothetical protein